MSSSSPAAGSPSLNLARSSVGGDISNAKISDTSKRYQEQNVKVAVESPRYPEQVYEMLREEIVEKRIKIEELQEKCRKLEEKSRAVESLFEIFCTTIIGGHSLSINLYITYTCLYLKDNNLIDDFWRYVPDNLKVSGKEDA